MTIVPFEYYPSGSDMPLGHGLERAILEKVIGDLAASFVVTPLDIGDPHIRVSYKDGVIIRPYGCRIENVVLDHSVSECEMEAINPRINFLPSTIQSGEYSARIIYNPMIPETRF